MIAMEFARFLGLPMGGRANLTDVVEAVCGICADARTTLIAVDEIHNVNLQSRMGAEVSDALKYFSERIPATFAYAGIDVEHVGLLSGIRGAQIAGRFSLVPTGRFRQGASWTALVGALDDSLRLHRHRPGTLTKLDVYLHHRTGGTIGGLLRLARSAAITAVLDGSEVVNRATLERITLDIASTQAHEEARRQRRPAA
jgi:hypothetical protein